jgi:hypothetical protein
MHATPQVMLSARNEQPAQYLKVPSSLTSPFAVQSSQDSTRPTPSSDRLNNGYLSGGYPAVCHT